MCKDFSSNITTFDRQILIVFPCIDPLPELHYKDALIVMNGGRQAVANLSRSKVKGHGVRWPRMRHGVTRWGINVKQLLTDVAGDGY